MNNVSLLGRLTADPETRISGNTTVTRFRLAVDNPFQKGDNKADFFQLVCFNKTAEIAQKHLRKGQRIAIIGRLYARNYEDKNGIKHYLTEVIVSNIYFADNKKSDDKSTENKGKSDNILTSEIDFSDLELVEMLDIFNVENL
ncbi:hypothetical protein FACS1894132_14790 [Clostridia bacterium]|nr:hypothetical protein FACS1894132_14790 [Clostridia bacterium]